MKTEQGTLQRRLTGIFMKVLYDWLGKIFHDNEEILTKVLNMYLARFFSVFEIRAAVNTNPTHYEAT